MSRNFIVPETTDSISEYDSSDKDISVVGRLAKQAEFWEKIGTPHYILDIIKNGYRMPLESTPENKILRNNASSRNDPEFVQKSIDELLISGAIVEVPKPTAVVNPLSVSTKHGKNAWCWT